MVIQDEQLRNWAKTGHGKAVQHSILGRVKAKLKTLSNVVVLDRFIPTTKFCYRCAGVIEGVGRYDKTVTCCGITEDRDIHAAKAMLWIAQNLFQGEIRLGRSEFKRADFLARLKEYHEALEVAKGS